MFMEGGRDELPECGENECQSRHFSDKSIIEHTCLEGTPYVASGKGYCVNLAC